MYNNFLETIKKIFSKFFGNRIAVLGCLLLPLIVVLVVRLFQLQIVRGSEYYENYVNTTRKEVSIPALRGNIYDRNGTLLAGNRVVYSVTLTDEEYYSKKNGEYNEMLLRLIRILERYGEEPVNTIPAVVSDNGEYVFSGSESRIRRFIRDVYGKQRIEDRQKAGEDPYADSAETVIEYLKKNLYNFSSSWKAAETVSKEDALKICDIRYALAATAFTRYITTAIVSDISEELKAAVLESRNDLIGVNVEETYERVYYNSECFSCILGYVGSATIEEIDELNAGGGDYIAGDVVGKEGIESAYESYLQGTKGKKLIYVNNKGIVLYEEVLEEPAQGQDVYLSIDANMTIATYNVMEQQLAGIIVNHLYIGTDYDPEIAYENSEYLIPIRDVYFQMINNNILSMKHMASAEASATERTVYLSMDSRKRAVVRDMENMLRTRDTMILNDMDEYTRAYTTYLYTFLNSSGYLIASNVAAGDEMYAKWKEGETSFPELLLYALKNGWADMSKLAGDERYNTVDACYDYVTEILLTEISRSFGEFDKLVYDELIHTDRISGCEIGRMLLDQGILEKNAQDEALLSDGTNESAYDFFEAKITAMELSPSQIALDPCSAGLVLTDPNSGELLAVVSYPGYDSNQINNSAYYSRLLNDLSSPLYSRATQSRLAPGSTFKMVTATAALEGGFIWEGEELHCEGIYDKLDHPRCWIYRLEGGEHGWLSMVNAIGQSCNCFFYECGYRFSTNANGQYSPSQGVNVINKYAEMYGFGSKTGIECAENVSVLTTELPVTSAIGQGTFAFTTISLARYVTALASSGNVYELRLLDRVRDKEGVTVLSHEPTVVNHLNLKDSTWDLLHRGMYTVVHQGGSRNGDFAGLRYDYAAKSGSAQENRLRAEHGWYVTYGPYDDIKYAMAVQIPNGYSSGNAALIAKGVYEYLEGDITLEEILENSAASGSINDILD